MEPALMEKAIAGLAEAGNRIEQTRKEMEASNSRVAELLKKQEAIESGQTSDRKSLETIKEELNKLADKVLTLANQYTESIHVARQFMKQNAEGGGDESKSWRYRSEKSKGAIFDSKQQALELGMYFMATMAKGVSARQYARQWLKDHKQDLRYIPQVPTSFLQDLGADFAEQMKKLDAGRIHVQDLGGSSVPGSVLVRPQFADTLIRNVEEHGKFRQNALIWPMGAETVYIPRRVSGVSVYWEGEAEAASTTDPDFELLRMTAKKMLMLHKFSSELNEDSALSIADLVMFEFALAIAGEEDRIGFNGDGSGGNSPGFAGFTGVLGANNTGTFEPALVTGAAGDDLSTEVKHGKLRAMTGLLPTWARAGAKWYMHRTVLADITAIEVANVALVTSFDVGLRKGIMGDPVVEVDQMPTSASVSASEKFIAYGDLRKSWILGDRRSVELQTSEHYAFNTDQLAMRVSARVAFLMQHGGGMVVYKSGTA